MVTSLLRSYVLVPESMTNGVCLGANAPILSAIAQKFSS